MMRDVLDYIECEVCGVEFPSWETHACARRPAMSEPTLTDEQREALDQWYIRDHEVPMMDDGPLDRLHAVVAALLADERAAREAAEAKVRDLTAGIGALAEVWRYKGEFGWGPWQEGYGPDLEGEALDMAATRLRALVDDPAAALAEVRAEAWDEGYEAGRDDEVFAERGMWTDLDANEYPHHNPHRVEAEGAGR